MLDFMTPLEAEFEYEFNALEDFEMLEYHLAINGSFQIEEY